LLEEIHRLAIRYHWSEAEILRLPLPRRTGYLELIDRDEIRTLASQIGGES